MKLQLTTVAASVALAASAFAGTTVASKGGPIAPPEPTVEKDWLFDNLNANLSVGYASDYIFRGQDFGADYFNADLNIGIALIPDTLTLTLGATYHTIFDDDDEFYDVVNQAGGLDNRGYDKLNLYANLGYKVSDLLSVGVTYTWYKFFNTGNDGDANTHEVGTYIVVSPVAGLDIATAYFYDTEDNSHYAQSEISYSIPVATGFSLVPYVGVSHAWNYYSNETGFGNAWAGLKAPVRLTEWATLTPFVTYSRNLGYDYDINSPQESGGDKFWGGVSLNVAF